MTYSLYIVFDSMYETMSISTGLYPNLDLWNANKLHYITYSSHTNTHLTHHKCYIHQPTDGGTFTPKLLHNTNLKYRVFHDFRA